MMTDVETFKSSASADRNDHPSAERRQVRIPSPMAPIVYFSFFTLVVLTTWFGAVESGVANEFVLPSPIAVGSAFLTLLREVFFWDAVGATLQSALLGFVFGSIGAWIFGSLIGVFTIVRSMIYPWAVVIHNTPNIAIAPLILTWFGFGLQSKVIVAALICFFPLLLNVVTGIRTLRSESLDLMQTYGASKRQIYFKLAVPAALPLFFAGLKTAVTLSLIGAIVAEFIAANEGLGVLIMQFNASLNIAQAFACVVALAGLGLTLFGITALVERSVIRWPS